MTGGLAGRPFVSLWSPVMRVQAQNTGRRSGRTASEEAAINLLDVAFEETPSNYSRVQDSYSDTHSVLAALVERPVPRRFLWPVSEEAEAHYPRS